MKSNILDRLLILVNNLIKGFKGNTYNESIKRNQTKGDHKICQRVGLAVCSLSTKHVGDFFLKIAGFIESLERITECLLYLEAKRSKFYLLYFCGIYLNTHS